MFFSKNRHQILKSTLLFLLTGLIYVPNNFAQQYSQSWTDLDYGDTEEVYHQLDIYLPEEEKTSYPAIIAIYGSAWFGNNLKASAFQTLSQPLLNASFAVITPNHRASTDSIYPAQIQDIKAAIRYVRANAEEFQIDTSFVGITGISSGGHLAALAGTSGGVKTESIGSATADIEGSVGAHTDFSSSVDAVVDWFGPTDITIMAECEGGGSIDHNAPDSPESVLVGGPIQENKDKGMLANPIIFVNPSDPPFLIFHGDQDPLVPPCQSELLYEALQDSGVASEYVLMEGGGHGPGVLTDENFKKMTEFFLREYNAAGTSLNYTDHPKSFRLAQNYPNPFNPNTVIRYQLPVSSEVSLKVFDLMGREVEKLDTGKKSAGTHSKQWKAINKVSGTYLVRLKAGSYVDTKKLTLIK